jgi:hypothetical protein
LLRWQIFEVKERQRLWLGQGVSRQKVSEVRTLDENRFKKMTELIWYDPRNTSLVSSYVAVEKFKNIVEEPGLLKVV